MGLTKWCQFRPVLTASFQVEEQSVRTMDEMPNTLWRKSQPGHFYSASYSSCDWDRKDHMTTAQGKTGSDAESTGCQHCYSTVTQIKATSLSSATIRTQSFPTRSQQRLFLLKNWWRPAQKTGLIVYFYLWIQGKDVNIKKYK